MRGSVNRTPFCCGLYEIGGFDNSYSELAFQRDGSLRYGYSTMSRNYTYMSVTRRLDLKQKKWLKKNGFKKAGSWKNPNTRKTLTLWLKFPAK